MGTDAIAAALTQSLKQELEEEVKSSEEDPETHYNLGVAFREMGLLDEAIGELQKVCQAVDRGQSFPQLMQTYTWLAQCFLDKGVPEAAIKWYDKALKPIPFDRFLKASNKAYDLLKLKTASAPKEPGFFFVHAEYKEIKIFYDDILYVEGLKDYVKIFLTGGRHFLVKRAISVIENILSDHKFIRVHRSYIVSLSKISGYNALVVQIGQCEIPIGRLYKQSVMERLQSKESA